MSKTYKWGIIGPGKIADKFAQALTALPDSTLHAVASRSKDRAREFAGKHHASKYYDTYEALVRDSEIDAVYIATPHTFHLEHTLLCFQYGKPVLCEKPMSVDLKSTEMMITAAKKHHLFLMEAMWTRFLPTIDKTLALIKAGEIGEVKYVHADFGFVVPFDPSSRLYDIKLGGGSLLDVGVYPLFLALLLLGKPDSIQSFAKLSATGADETTNAMLTYHNGASASILSSIVMQTPLKAEIYGTNGVITIQRPWYKGSEIVVTDNDNIKGKFTLPFGSNGFEFEIREVQRCLENSEKESSLMPLNFSLLMAETVDTICRQCNIRYN